MARTRQAAASGVYLVSVAESWVPCPRFVGMCLDTEETRHGQASLAIAPPIHSFPQQKLLGLALQFRVVFFEELGDLVAEGQQTLPLLDVERNRHPLEPIGLTPPFGLTLQ